MHELKIIRATGRGIHRAKSPAESKSPLLRGTKLQYLDWKLRKKNITELTPQRRRIKFRLHLISHIVKKWPQPQAERIEFFWGSCNRSVDFRA